MLDLTAGAEVDGAKFDHAFLASGTHYEIPYRCLLPAGLDGLLVTGRCISVDHHALGSIRRMVAAGSLRTPSKIKKRTLSSIPTRPAATRRSRRMAATSS